MSWIMAVFVQIHAFSDTFLNADFSGDIWVTFYENLTLYPCFYGAFPMFHMEHGSTLVPRISFAPDFSTVIQAQTYRRLSLSRIGLIVSCSDSLTLRSLLTALYIRSNTLRVSPARARGVIHKFRCSACLPSFLFINDNIFSFKCNILTFFSVLCVFS